MTYVTNKFALLPGVALIATLFLSTPAHASDAGAFIGGMLANKVLNNMQRRTRAEEEQAYNSRNQQPVRQVEVVQSAAPSPAAAPTTKQRLDQLDKLASGGYITPEEYKAKKKDILNSL